MIKVITASFDNTAAPVPSQSPPRRQGRERGSQSTMGRAIAKVNGTEVASAEKWETVEGNIYFPPDSVSDKSVLSGSTLTTYCPWKGTSRYYDITIDGDVLKDTAWYYPEPKDAAKNIKDHIAFYKSKVQVFVED